MASPGVSLDVPFFVEARRRGLEIVGDIELFARAVDAPVVGITGTNGKSTVTTLVGRMAARAGISVRVGGNLGEPALDLLTTARADVERTELYVLELSSFQLEATSSLDLKTATVLNVTRGSPGSLLLDRRLCRREGPHLCPLRHRSDQPR